MQLSFEIDYDFMQLFREACEFGTEFRGASSETEVLRTALLEFLTGRYNGKHKTEKRISERRISEKRISKSEKAKLDYLKETTYLIPKIIRRNSKQTLLKSL